MPSLTVPIELSLSVSFNYFPGNPAVMYLPNGDPGYPEEPADIEITEVLFDKQNILEKLSDEEIERIEDYIFENWSKEDSYPDAEDYEPRDNFGPEY